MQLVSLRTLVLFTWTVLPLAAGPIGFNLIPLVTNTTDSQLVNPWGIAASGGGPFWLGVNGSGVSTVYNAAGVKQAAFATIPGDGSVTGVAFNGTSDFGSDLFLFASEDGTVSGWRNALGTNAETLQIASVNNVYKGITIDTTGGFSYALLANFESGAVNVLKGNALAPNLAGSFTDPGLPAGYAPFNIASLGGVIYVTYAAKGAGKDELDGPGLGFVSAFNLDGTFIGRLVSGGQLNAPWGLAIAPVGFGNVGGDLLVGNFGDGTINAYNATTGVFVQTLQNALGDPLTIDGLWGMRFGNGAASGSLFITAGPDDESGGLFARIDAIPEPGTWLLAGLGLTALIVRRRWKTT